jgi:CheY-like chemotaxis protein
MLRRLVGEDIEICTELDNRLHSIQADPTGIDQVLLNLSVNARDAMPNGGHLIIRTMNVIADESTHPELQPGEYVCMEVEDDGCGMSEDTRKRIFEPFFTTKGPGRGTGLGLSTVFGVVEQNEGHITVQSEEGKGTRVGLYFPVFAHAPVTETQVRDEAPGGSETILLVEDDKALLELNKELLESLGYTVITAGTGKAALAEASRMTNIDLLLTDIVMPEMNGRILVEKLTALRPEMKVLYVSGYTNNIIQADMLDTRSAFLQKPFSRDALARKIRELLAAEPEPRSKAAEIYS